VEQVLGVNERLASEGVLTFTQPTHAGSIKVADNVYFSVVKKPNFWKRFWMKWLLGWTWHEEI
jgi:hypothetical protein